MTPSLKQELKKRNPFDSVQQEATLAILRTSDLLENRLARLLREYGLTPTQYNVLRILRGEGQGMPCLEVAERMIQVAPAITRVVEKLVSLKWITKTQSGKDRRVFEIELTTSGKKLLEKLDQPILDLHSSLLKGLKKSEMSELIRILESLRGSIKD